VTSRVEAVIDAAKAQGRGVLIGYLPAGFPTIDDSVDAVLALARGGADIIELGVPYSDPVMDGVVIQRATNTALANGFKLTHLFDVLRRVTAETDVPVLVMTYWNPVVQYGVDRSPTKLRSGLPRVTRTDLTVSSSRLRRRQTSASETSSRHHAALSMPSQPWASPAHALMSIPPHELLWGASPRRVHRVCALESESPPPTRFPT
jgi:tryptophan synthase alpha subunit